jgi:secreted trypsin-like serine protease
MMLSLNDNLQSLVEGTNLTILGVGLGWLIELTPFLRDVDVHTVNIDECNNAYGNPIVEDVMFCAGVPEGGKDSYQGDSGGPIIQWNMNKHVQIGAVSWGFGCAQSGITRIYSWVSSARDWIHQMVCNEWGASA